MKSSPLVTAFQKYPESQDRKAEEAVATPAPVASRPPEPAAAETRTAPTDDIVTVSPQAVFLFAASQFDPQRISRPEITELADTLRDGWVISGRDHMILTSRADPGDITNSPNSNFREAGDRIANFQGRLSYDLAKSNVANVEADTRALSILGRLASIREELL